MIDAYYDALRHESDDSRRVGWRHRIEQAYRFEVALDIIRPGDVILDVGSGLGALAHYLRARGIDAEVVGLERNPEFIEATRHHRVIRGDYRDIQHALPRHDVAVAIGATSGGVTTSESLTGLVRTCSAADRAFCVVAIDASRVSARPAIAGDPSLGFVDPGELVSLAQTVKPDRSWRCTLESIAEVEFGLFATRSDELVTRSAAARWRAACDGPWGVASASRRAWLAYEASLYEIAARELEQQQQPDELGAIVADRLSTRP